MSTSRAKILKSLAGHLEDATNILSDLRDVTSLSRWKDHLSSLSNHLKIARRILSDIWDNVSLYRAFAHTMDVEYVGHEEMEETIDAHQKNLTELITLAEGLTVPEQIAEIHRRNLKELKTLVANVTRKGTGKERPLGTRRPELKALDQLMVKEAITWWKEKRCRPAIWTDQNGRICGPFVDQVLLAAQIKSSPVTVEQIGEAHYWLKRSPECGHLFNHGQKNQEEIYAHFLGRT